MDYEYIEVNLLVNEHLKESYSKVNPIKKVPCLILATGEVIY